MVGGSFGIKRGATESFDQGRPDQGLANQHRIVIKFVEYLAQSLRVGRVAPDASEFRVQSIDGDELLQRDGHLEIATHLGFKGFSRHDGFERFGGSGPVGVIDALDLLLGFDAFRNGENRLSGRGYGSPGGHRQQQTNRGDHAALFHCRPR